MCVVFLPQEHQQPQNLPCLINYTCMSHLHTWSQGIWVYPCYSTGLWWLTFLSPLKLKKAVEWIRTLNRIARFKNHWQSYKNRKYVHFLSCLSNQRERNEKRGGKKSRNLLNFLRTSFFSSIFSWTGSSATLFSCLGRRLFR